MKNFILVSTLAFFTASAFGCAAHEKAAQLQKEKELAMKKAQTKTTTTTSSKKSTP